MNPRVLIVGAGPTGLVLALWLNRLGERPRIIDRSDQPGQTSRAVGVQARTLEFYHQLGIADEVISGGIKMDALTMRTGDRTIFRAPLGDFGLGMSPYPFILSYPQDDHERLLIEYLESEGVTVERNTELTGLTQDDDRVRVTLKTPRGEETAEAEYVCGCDGAHSGVRGALGVGFPGGTYDRLFFVTDTKATGEAAMGSISPCLSRDGFCLVLPVRSSGSVRLIGIVPAEVEKKDPITWEDVAPFVLRQTGLKVEAVNWFATYHVHHRVVEHFRSGRVFLSGDAAHIHSPAGAQGMNTGIGDAVNLSWKLAAVLQRRAAPVLLDTYEPERLAFARTLVQTTDTLFQFLASRTWAGWFFRGVVAPRVLPFLMGFKSIQRFMFRGISQIQISYRDSRLSTGSAGQVRGGDRLPWVVGDGINYVDNFDPLRSLDWQVHSYGEASAETRAVIRQRGLPLHEFPWTAEAQNAGLSRDALYLIRPDGYVAYAGPGWDAARLERFASDFEIVPRAGA
jgi:2-polyprenyl-6-methoxyphenol hydroxylase-like FAD-dependent oxidoreductase